MALTRILFAWEFGANLGHLSRNLPLARKCRDAGYEVIWVVPDLLQAVLVLGSEQFTLLQAPLLRRSASRDFAAPVNFADMLLKLGLGDESAFTAVVAGWIGILRYVDPTVMVYDHAPNALVAARVTQTPVLLVGTGFELPPAVSPFPPFQPWAAPAREALLAIESELTQRINARLLALNCPPISSVSQLYAGKQFITSFPQLDFFRGRPGARYVGPISALSSRRSMEWLTPTKPHILVYLTETLPVIDSLLEALQGAGAEVICALKPSQALKDRFGGLRWADGVVDIEALLPDCSLVVTSGPATSSAALLGGVPVLVVPESFEQFLAGRCLEATGAGLLARRHPDISQFSSLLEKVLTQSSFREAAGRCAHQWREFDRDRAVQGLFDELNILAGATN